MTSPQDLVSSLERRFRRLETEFHGAYWKSQVEASAENDARRADLELELRTVKGDRVALQAVEAALGEGVRDPMLQRQLELLRLSLTGNQMTASQRQRIVELSTSIESDFTSHRARLDGEELSENDIEDILRSSNDPELRKRTWEASKQIGAVVADRVRDLASVRNEVARDLGYENYYDMALSLQEIDTRWLFETLGELEDLTLDPFSGWKDELDAALSERFGAGSLYPWHYGDPFFQSLPPDGRVTLDGALAGEKAADLARETFARWEVDLAAVLAESDLYPRARKCQHGFCLDVDRTGRDVRILANVVPGERWIEVLLHESGHACYDVEIDRTLPYLLHRPAHTFVTEAMAIVSGRLVRDPHWLTEVADVPDEAVGKIRHALQRAQAAQSLLFARWGLVMVHFERALYADPSADLDTLWWDLVERFQLVDRPPGRASADWAAKIHVAAAPVYYHNYLLGEMLASQLRAACERSTGGFVASGEAGARLKDKVFRHGALMRWDDLIEGATNRPLSARDFAETLDLDVAASASPPA